MYNYVFFDLDGTLTQSEFGILNSVAFALEKLGIKVDNKESLKKFIGPPLAASFRDFFGMDEENIEKAIGYYRECYNGGEIFNAPLYDGIEETLKTLSDNGVKMFVVTSKPAHMAKKIIEHFDISKYFEDVVGPDLKDRSYSKKELVEAAINKATDTPNLKDYIMIGDRCFDIEGAVGNNIDSIGVLYGYGNREELANAGATYIIDFPKDIVKTVL
ncbi:HAD hydrolase-like protein [Eubacterium sp.]|uniref:HAD hydrolase-like protein n=1 Tax=Eubacterium sp. TaxID=142586 RepID=UPI0025CED741|nr:HAD hydrolase-like protein [Eubacterium sp.]MCR5629238.1 HAD hydrolase-like protein [Eubacterium sp.]